MTRYWDFNENPSLPQAVKEPTIRITIPGENEGEKQEVVLEHNPFYSYKFTSDYAWTTVAQELDWANHRQVWYLLRLGLTFFNTMFG